MSTLRKTISSELTIAAAATAVWNLLTDLSGYASWNPFIRSASGILSPGRRLDLTLQIPDGLKMRIRPRLISVIEEREIRWLGHLGVSGLFDGDHRFLISPLKVEGKTLLRQEETFSGLLVPIFGSWIGGGALRGFAAMNKAARRHLESRGCRPAPP
jgi:hypothetical protein